MSNDTIKHHINKNNYEYLKFGGETKLLNDPSILVIQSIILDENL